MLTLIGELKRRRVFRVASVYIAASLGVIYAADVILPRLSAPDWTVTAVMLLAGLRLFVAIALAWPLDVTPASASPGSRLRYIKLRHINIERSGRRWHCATVGQRLGPFL